MMPDWRPNAIIVDNAQAELNAIVYWNTNFLCHMCAMQIIVDFFTSFDLIIFLWFYFLFQLALD